MDYFAKYNQEAFDLKNNIVNAMKEVLKEKGYVAPKRGENTVVVRADGKRIELYYDRIIVNDWHTDHVSIENLLEALQACYHVIPNFANFGY